MSEPRRKREHEHEEYFLPYHWCLTGFYRYLHELKFRYALRYLARTDRVLDLGGGDGRLSALIAPLVREVWCVDTNERALKFGEVIAGGDFEPAVPEGLGREDRIP